jgi:hypothetical protein
VALVGVPGADLGGVPAEHAFGELEALLGRPAPPGDGDQQCHGWLRAFGCEAVEERHVVGVAG